MGYLFHRGDIVRNINRTPVNTFSVVLMNNLSDAVGVAFVDILPGVKYPHFCAFASNFVSLDTLTLLIESHIKCIFSQTYRTLRANGSIQTFSKDFSLKLA